MTCSVLTFFFVKFGIMILYESTTIMLIHHNLEMTNNYNDKCERNSMRYVGATIVMCLIV